MFESGVSASWVTLPTGELLVGETLRRAVGSPTGPDTAAVLVAISGSVRSGEERGLLAEGWAKVTAWAAAQAAEARGDSAGVTREGQAGLGAATATAVDSAAATPDTPGSTGPAGVFVPWGFRGTPGEVRAQAFVEQNTAGDVVERACTVPAGPEQVAALARIEPALLSGDGVSLISLIEAYERQVSWLTARKLAVVAEVHDATARAMRQHPDSLHEMWTRDGIAAGLHVAPGTAAGWVWFARRLKVDFPGIRVALTSGDLTVQQAKAILEELPTGWDEATRADAETRLVQAGRRLAPARLRAQARALAIALDPEGAAHRRRVAAEANVGIEYRPLADGLGQLTVVASAVDTQTLWQAVDGVARRRRGKRRVTEEDGCGCPDNPTLGQDRVAALMELATGQAPAYGPAAVSAGGDTATDGGAAAGAGSTAEAAPHGSTAVQPSAADAGADDAAMDAGGIRLPVGPRTQVHVVVDLPTLLGLADHPAVLQGYGPVDPDLARELARDGDWLRWVTDPVTGHLLDDGDRRFPGRRLRRFIKARDPVCVVPGCHQPSRVADVDHVNGGYRTTRHTAASTLVAACVGHNRSRDDAGWTATMRDDTSIEWTTTLGEKHLVPPRRVLPDTPPAVPTISLNDEDPPF